MGRHEWARDDPPQAAAKMLLEQDGVVGRARLGLEGPVRAGHHAQHIAAGVLQAGDVIDRAVGVVGV